MMVATYFERLSPKRNFQVRFKIHSSYLKFVYHCVCIDETFEQGHGEEHNSKF